MEYNAVGFYDTVIHSESGLVLKRHYVEPSDIRIDITIPVGSLFGPERDRYCRLLYRKAIRRGELLDSWQMWQKTSSNTLECKYCRLHWNTEFIRHDCGWWEDIRRIRGQVCFCYCHDNLGYVLLKDEIGNL